MELAKAASVGVATVRRSEAARSEAMGLAVIRQLLIAEREPKRLAQDLFAERHALMIEVRTVRRLEDGDELFDRRPAQVLPPPLGNADLSAAILFS
jgi:hypothetical protein